METQRKVEKLGPAPVPKAVKSAVRVSLRYNCGCQFITTEAREAAQHVVDTGHVVSVAGLIRPLEVRG